MRVITNATVGDITIHCSKCKLNQKLLKGKTHVCPKDKNTCKLEEDLKARGPSLG